MGNRIFWACQKVEAATAIELNDDASNELPANGGSADFKLLTAVNSVGLNTNLNLENIFQLGQLEVYQEYEELPEVEVTINRRLNGQPTLYGIMVGDGSIIDNLQTQSAVRFSLYEDKTVDDPSPPLVTQYTCSPAYISQITYTFPVDGDFTEEVTVVSNSKVQTAVAPRAYTGDEQTGTIFRRGSLDESGFPSRIAGKKVQNVTVSINLGREEIRKLGQKRPFMRYIELPLEITTEFEVLATEEGDGLEATSGQDDCDLNATPQADYESITLTTCDGMTLNLGNKNKLMSTSFSGGDASGGNATITYSYRNWNTLTYTSP